jgi:hypothetical protein
VTSTELERRSVEVVHLDTNQIRYIANTDFVPKQYRGKLDQIMACIATGRELGIGDMQALRSINVIDGRPSLSAELMVQLARRHGHSITGSTGPETATVKGKRADNGDEMTVEWTLEMAKRAGLVRKDNWVRYPEAMLWNRAVSQLCRMLFPDVLAGASYTPDELDTRQQTEAIEQELAALPLASEVVDEPSPEPLPDIEPELELPEGQSQFEQLAEQAQKKRPNKETGE